MAGNYLLTTSRTSTRGWFLNIFGMASIWTRLKSLKPCLIGTGTVLNPRWISRYLVIPNRVSPVAKLPFGLTDFSVRNLK